MAEPRAPGPPPKEALEWFRAKGLKIGFDWRDVWREEHAAAFTVAKIMRLDLLADVRAEVDRALAEGLTFRDFQKRLAPMLQEKGWWGVQDMADPQTGEVRQVQLGSPRRLRVIYDTNLRTARAAGQWARIQKTREGLPYLLYTVGPSREHRPEHLSWHGTLLPVDDPWWKTHFVPNGWGCKCRIRQISRREYERLKESGVPAPPSAATQDINPKTGLPTGRRARATVPVKTTAPKLSAVEWTNQRTGEVMEVPRGIDPGWDYNPGEGRLSHLQKLLAEKERQWRQPEPIDPGAPVRKPRRTPWPRGFPPVEIVADTPVAQGHPSYAAAKQGDLESALQLVSDLLTEDQVASLRLRFGDRGPLLAAVHGVEGTSVNAIPQVMAGYLSSRLGWEPVRSLVQINRVGHTKSSGWHRLANQALFDGEVLAGRHYLLLDDFIGQGGTLANLRAFIETQGGRVVGASALTGKTYSSILALTDETLTALRAKHGNLENWWRERFGFGFDGLTESEARYLLRAEDADTIRNRLAEAESKSRG